MKSSWLILSLLMLAGASRSVAADPGSVTGTLKVDGKEVPLKYVQAVQFNALEEVGMDSEIKIALTDVDVMADQTYPAQYFFESLGPIYDLGNEGKVHGIVLKIDPKAPQGDFNALLLYPPKNPNETLISFFGTPVLKDFNLSADRIKGEISYSNPGGESVPAIELTALIDAPIVPDDSITTKLTGPKAMSSPQVKAFLNYAQALSRGDDLKKLSPLMTPRGIKELEKVKDRIGEKEFKKGLMSVYPAPAKFKKQIKEVYARGQRAWVAFLLNGDKVWKTLIQEKEGWKID